MPRCSTTPRMQIPTHRDLFSSPRPRSGSTAFGKSSPGPTSMTNEALADLVASTGPILLDFDGPVTQLLPPPANAEIARLARQPLLHEGIRLPSEIAETTDHIAALRFAGAIGGESQARVEGLCIAAEVGAARRSVPTVGVIAMLRAAQVVARPVSIVSNNHRDAVEAFLVTHKLLHLVHSIFGRVDGAPELMKPDPYV